MIVHMEHRSDGRYRGSEGKLEEVVLSAFLD